MKNVLNILMVLGLGLSASPALARGGWVSSGGEIFQLGKNPWFVKNANDVHYCVSIDPNGVTASQATVLDAVAQAFNYWKNEMKQQTAPSAGFAALATQNFIYDSSCTANEDIHFYIGYDTLLNQTVEGQDLIEYLGDPQKYVGVSVRTGYDNVTMRGHGFVFISSDTGAHPYHNTGNLIEKAWLNPKLLQYALIHETGHVMGLPHSGTGIMSEVFLEQLINSRFSKFYLQNPIQSFFNPPMVFEVCTMNGSFNADFFKVDPATTCLRLEGTHTGTQFNWNVFSRATATSNAVPAGSIKGNLLLDNIVGARPAVVIQLPDEQTVFGLTEKSINTFMLGPIFVEGSVKAAFVAAGSPKPYDLQVELRTDTVSAVGVVGGRQMPVLVYSPPSLLKMLFPINVGP